MSPTYDLSQERKGIKKPVQNLSQPTPAHHPNPLNQHNPIDVAQMQPSQMLSLQRSIGNFAVQELIAQSRPASAPTVQAKLEVGPASDRYEQEADRIANQVVTSQAVSGTPATKSPVQRASGNDQLQRDLIQRFHTEEEEAEEEDYEPTGQEIGKEMGMGKRLGLRALLGGARAGDWAMNKFRKNKKRPLTDRAEGRTIGTYVNARNRLHQKNNMKGLSRSERRQYRREERAWQKEADRQYEERDQPGMINF